jgi:hypothetical protein
MYLRSPSSKHMQAAQRLIILRMRSARSKFSKSEGQKVQDMIMTRKKILNMKIRMRGHVYNRPKKCGGCTIVSSKHAHMKL